MMLLRRAAAAPERDEPRCGDCARTPLPGEVMHVRESGEATCALCLGSTPEDEREPARAVRVHAGDRRLAVFPRAA